MKDLGRRAAIIGLGISGFQTALYLKRHDFHVFVSEMRKNPETETQAATLKSQGIETELGSHSFEKILACDWVMISPGISPSTEIHQALERASKPIFSEIEVASWFSRSSKIIAVTGTAGKTTAATLITEWLQKAGQKAICCGNIGNPWISELDQITPDHFVVIEVSSFQLFHCEKFRPKVAILLNISPNHLDWHPTMDHYVQAKLKFFSRQERDDLAVFSAQDQMRYFPQFKFQSKTAFYDAENGSSAIEKILKILARFFKLSEASIQKTLSEFKGIEHRLECVDSYQGISFVNDSKCTTPLSLGFALEQYPDEKILLLVGGRAKSKDFETLRPFLQKKVKKAFIYGESASYIRAAWEGACETMVSKDLSEAFDHAVESAAKNDVVLLSPACASFDQFKNYQERGRFFKEKVTAWTHKPITASRA